MIESADQMPSLTTLAKAAGLSVPGELLKLWDFSLGVGGPIVRDRLWYFGNVRNEGSHRSVWNQCQRQPRRAAARGALDQARAGEPSGERRGVRVRDGRGVEDLVEVPRAGPVGGRVAVQRRGQDQHLAVIATGASMVPGRKATPAGCTYAVSLARAPGRSRRMSKNP